MATHNSDIQLCGLLGKSQATTQDQDQLGSNRPQLGYNSGSRTQFFSQDSFQTRQLSASSRSCPQAGSPSLGFSQLCPPSGLLGTSALLGQVLQLSSLTNKCPEEPHSTSKPPAKRHSSSFSLPGSASPLHLPRTNLLVPATATSTTPTISLPLGSAVLCIFIFSYCVIREVIYPYVYEKKDETFRMTISIPNRVFPIAALTLLALVYLPGVIAAILQLYRGTKYRRFPDWLDHWMLCRKQLGLVALGFAFLHVLYTLVIPIRYYVRWRLRNITITQAANKDNPFSTSSAWVSDSYVALGILGFFLFVLLGITSLPSVSNMVNWREFRFVQSKLGYLTLILCTAHTLVYGGKRFLSPSILRWCLPSAYVLALIIPCTVLVIKFILIMPCIDKTLTRIRQGWERNSKISSSLNGKTDI